MRTAYNGMSWERLETSAEADEVAEYIIKRLGAGKAKRRNKHQRAAQRLKDASNTEELGLVRDP